MVLPLCPFFPGPVKHDAKQVAEATQCHGRAFDLWYPTFMAKLSNHLVSRHNAIATDEEECK